MSYSRDSGAPAYGDANTNVRVDFVYGNMPIQPNEGRGMFQSGLDTLDSHKIALTEWAYYPTVHSGINNVIVADGTTFNSGNSFYWPSMGVCLYFPVDEMQLLNYQNFFKSVGVDPTLLKDFTFSGGSNEWDISGTPNYDGNVFYYYIPAEEIMGQSWSGELVYGSKFDGVVLYGDHTAGDDVAVDGNWYDYAIIVITNDPRKNTHVWWDN
jgi:hypothetical protein